MRTSSFGLLLTGMLASAAGVLPASPAAARQCTWSIGSLTNGFVPDFDQKRKPGPLFFDGMNFVNIPPGLPGEGVAYCCPTAHINWMAYFANHGFPGLMPGGTSPSFQSQTEYANVNSAIFEMGLDYNTHPVDGTTCCYVDGTNAYLNRRAPNKFIVSTMYASGFYTPRLNDLAFCALVGGYVCPFVGWYTPDTGPNEYYRTGGHVVTMVGLEGWCTGTERKIKLRDPGNGDSDRLVQAAFATNTYEMEALPGYFAENDGGGGTQVFFQRTHDKLVGYGSPALLRGYGVMMPKAGVTLSPLNNSVSLLRPIQLTNGSQPTHGTIGNTRPEMIIDFAIGSDPISMYLVHRVPVGTQTRDEVWKVAMLDQAASPSAPEPNRRLYFNSEIRGIASGRDQDLFVITGDPDGSGPGGPSLVKINNDASTAAVAIPSLLNQTRRLLYDDGTDTIFLVDTHNFRVGTFTHDNFGIAPGRTYPLPTAVQLSGDEYACISPSDSSIWIRSRNSPNLYNLAIDRTAGLQVRQTVIIQDLIGTEGLDVQSIAPTDARVLVTRNGVIEEYARNTAGAWGPAADSDFAGFPSRGGVLLTRSRTNFDPNIMGGPANFDVLPSSSSPNEYDCPGDVNADGQVAFSDATAILLEWGSTDETNADTDSSGSVGFGDITKVLQNWGPCS